MKSKLRNIKIENNSFVYWYSGSEYLHLNISVKNNKNIKIKIIFKHDMKKKNLQTGIQTFYEISAIKNNIETTINLGRPEGVSKIISFLYSNNKNLFNLDKIDIKLDGFSLLRKMGYEKLIPIWKIIW